jgi:single-strand DNA-binding protein
LSLSLNRACLTGYLSTELELKYTPGGTAYARFSLATSESYNGQVQTRYHRIVALGKSGEACKKFLVKGQIAAVEGKIKYSNYEKDGKKVYAIDIVSFGRRKEQKEAAGDDIPWTL